MTTIGWLQIAVFFAAVVAVTKPLGVYMFRVFEGDAQPLPRVLGRFERLLYRLSGVDHQREQTWKQYTLALLLFSGVSLVVTYALLR
ncbi:MAG TPA: potassium-transporting ATPase subunit KdpA, partial [Polyangia bacterium]